MPGQRDVDGSTRHMQTVIGDTAAEGAQFCVARGRAVAGDHMEGFIRPDPALQRIEEIEQCGVNGADFIGAMVTQNAVDPGQRLGNEISFLPERRSQVFSGMQIME